MDTTPEANNARLQQEVDALKALVNEFQAEMQRMARDIACLKGQSGAGPPVEGEDATVLAEHDAAWKYAAEHNEPIGG